MLIHKTCLGEIEPIPEHGLYCLGCDDVVADIDVDQDEDSAFGKKIP